MNGPPIWVIATLCGVAAGLIILVVARMVLA